MFDVTALVPRSGRIETGSGRVNSLSLGSDGRESLRNKHAADYPGAEYFSAGRCKYGHRRPAVMRTDKGVTSGETTLKPGESSYSALYPFGRTSYMPFKTGARELRKE